MEHTNLEMKACRTSVASLVLKGMASANRLKLSWIVKP